MEELSEFLERQRRNAEGMSEPGLQSSIDRMIATLESAEPGAISSADLEEMRNAAETLRGPAEKAPEVLAMLPMIVQAFKTAETQYARLRAGLEKHGKEI